MALASLTNNYTDTGEHKTDEKDETVEDQQNRELKSEEDADDRVPPSSEKLVDPNSPEAPPDSPDPNQPQGPLLGPHPKTDSWSYKGFRDFNKAPGTDATTKDEAVPSKVAKKAPEGATNDDPAPDQSCYSYEGNVWIYTDPNTKARYMFDTSSNSWRAWDTTNYVYDGQTYWYTDQDGQKHRWNQYKNQWEGVLPSCPVPGGSGSVAGVVTADDKKEQMAMVYDYYQKKMSCNVAAFATSSGILPEAAKRNQMAAYANLVIDSAPSIQSKVDGDRAARQLNHYFDHDAWLKKENEGKNEKPKFTKKQIQLLKKRRQEKKYKKSIEWLLDDGCGG